MADYIDLALKFGFNTTLTASDTNQLIENITATSEQASGAPNIKYFIADTYTGDGNATQDITGLGFSPNWGMIFSTKNKVCFKSSTMDSNYNLKNDNGFSVVEDGINLFIDHGFKVKGSVANTSGDTYNYIMGHSQ